MEKEYKIMVKSFQELTNKEVYELLKLRFMVFVMEQGCHYLDPDGIDY
jgi:ElaA protein